MAKVKKSRCPKGSIRKGSRCVKNTKSKPKSIKKYKKTSPKKNKSPSKRSSPKPDVRGCSRQIAPKYMDRNSPPYPANQCCGRTMKGNDGEMYVSKSMSSAGHCRWVKAK